MKNSFSNYRNILYNCLKNLKRRGTEIFNLTNTTNEYQIKDDGQLEDLTDAVDFFRKKSEDYEAEG